MSTVEEKRKRTGERFAWRDLYGGQVYLRRRKKKTAFICFLFLSCLGIKYEGVYCQTWGSNCKGEICCMCRQHRTVLLCFVLGQKKKNEVQAKKKKRERKEGRERESRGYMASSERWWASVVKKKKTGASVVFWNPQLTFLSLFLEEIKASFNWRAFYSHLFTILFFAFIAASVFFFFCDQSKATTAWHSWPRHDLRFFFLLPYRESQSVCIHMRCGNKTEMW